VEGAGAWEGMEEVAEVMGDYIDVWCVISEEFERIVYIRRCLYRLYSIHSKLPLGPFISNVKSSRHTRSHAEREGITAAPREHWSYATILAQLPARCEDML